MKKVKLKTVDGETIEQKIPETQAELDEANSKMQAGKVKNITCLADLENDDDLGDDYEGL